MKSPLMLAFSRPSSLVLLVAALAVSVATPVAGQEDTRPTSQFEGMIEVSEVLLDVLVTDKDGDIVLGLNPEDFVIRENGQPVEITAATFYSNRRFVESIDTAAEIGISADDVPVNRYFVLMIHDQRQDFSFMARQQLDAARWIKRWIKNEMLNNDFVAVVSYDVKLKLHEDFTNDRKLIAKAVDNAVLGRDLGKQWPSRQEFDGGPSLWRHLPKGDELMHQSKRFTHAVRLVAESLGDTIGRKNLLLFSLGFGDVDEAQTWTPDPRYYAPMMRALNDHNVAVYTIDMLPRPQEGSDFVVGDVRRRALNDSLAFLAEQTGGTYFYNFVNFQTPMRQIADEVNGYYLLSYTSQFPAGETGFRDVVVETVNRSFEVKTRKGYRFGA